MDIKSLVRILYKNIPAIILTGIMVSAGLIYEKHIGPNYVIRSGDVFIVRNVQIQNYNRMIISGSKFVFNKYMNTYPMVEKFWQGTAQKYDYTKFDSGWNQKTKLDKLKWLQTRLIINDYGDGFFSIVFNLKSSDPKNIVYVEKNGANYIDEYARFADKELKNLNGETGIKVLESSNIFPEERQISKQDVLLKYGIIGFVLGVLLAAVFILVHAQLKNWRQNGSK